MSESQPKSRLQAGREPLKPEGITCPEGVWILEAMVLRADKVLGANEWEKRILKDTMQDLIAFLMETPEIEVFTINSYDGSKEAIDRDYLRSRTAKEDCLLGFIPFSDGLHVSKKEGRFIFVDKVQFQRYLSDQPIIDNTTSEQAVGLVNAYIPPYINLMLKAVEALNLTPDRRVNKDAVIGWLDQNWPVGLEGKSDRLIESMATLMRRPEDKKGGNTPWK